MLGPHLLDLAERVSQPCSGRDPWFAIAVPRPAHVRSTAHEDLSEIGADLNRRFQVGVRIECSEALECMGAIPRPLVKSPL